MIQKFTHNSKFYPLLQISPMIEIFANNYKFFFKSMLSFLYHEKYSFQICRNTNNKNIEIQITDLQKYNLQIYRNTYYSNTEIQIIKLKKYNLQKCRNTNDRITEIQVKNYTNIKY